MASEPRAVELIVYNDEIKVVDQVTDDEIKVRPFETALQPSFPPFHYCNLPSHLFIIDWWC